ncbi:hypothetical protein EAS68_04545 [Legionella jordanis]|uniref:hypothetical protein n=1 Tax=Legionella jordanis TaxID=456 RepID=UPI000EFEAC7E|nr:hypothetical protein [Legionella jordanis]RMX20980.1 hypothetical protein EAS68_04545 [Legionella jordanis]
MPIVIVGAGPNGLYAAIKLRRAGVKDIKVIGHHAGSYVRPGNINLAVFRKAERSIGLGAPPSTNAVHIKDIERALYKLALQLNIPVEEGLFVDFSTEEKGIFIKEANGEQKFLACDYVFDCTGSKRVLVHAINARAGLNLPKPFQISPISGDVMVRNHMLAYVKMSIKHQAILDYLLENKIYDLEGRTATEFADAMERLRQFGWREMGFPRCYFMPFGKNKACLYMEAPDGLSDAKKEAWLQTVLECWSDDSTISFQYLPQSKKYKFKPRFNTFTVDPHQLNRFTYKGEGLPYVITQGDVQVEPNYVLGHGIVGGFDRSDAFVEGLAIINGSIAYFNEEDYQEDVKEALRDHQEAIIQHYRKRREYFIRSLDKAQAKYQEALKLNPKPVYEERLNEVRSRIDYFNALNILQEKKTNGKIYSKQFNGARLIADLLKAKDLLFKAIVGLPALFQDEVNDAKSKLTQLAADFKEIGNQYYQARKFDLALQCYEEALLLYKSLDEKAHQSEILNIHSNLILTYRKLNQLDKVLEKTGELLKGHTIPEAILKKILFNLIAAGVATLKLDACQASLHIQEQMQELAGLCCKYEAFIHECMPELKGDLIKIQRFNNKILQLQDRGKQKFAEGLFPDALGFYEAALLLAQKEKHRDELLVLTLKSNIILTHRKLLQPEKALMMAGKALEDVGSASIELKKKILFNAFKAVLENLAVLDKDSGLINQAVILYLQHREFIHTHLEHDWPAIASELASALGQPDLLKTSAKIHFDQGQFKLALDCYGTILLVQKLSGLEGDVVAAMPIYANMVLAYRKLKALEDVVKTARTALDFQGQITDNYRKKILFNLISAAAEAIKSQEMDSNKLIKMVEEVQTLCAENDEFIKTHLEELNLELQAIGRFAKKTLRLQDLGKQSFSQNNFLLALQCFEEALLLAETETTRDRELESTLHSNIILTHRKLGQPERAFLIANRVLNDEHALPVAAKKKLLFNGFKAVSELIDLQQGTLDKTVLRKAAHFYFRHLLFIDQYLAQDLGDCLAKMRAALGDPQTLRDIGKNCFAQSKFELALVNYEDALLLQRLSRTKDHEAEASIAANLIIIYRKLHCPSLGFTLAEEILNEESSCSVNTKKKILFNLIKCAYEEGQNSLPEALEKTGVLLKQALALYERHQGFINRELARSLKMELAYLLAEKKLEPEPLKTVQFNQ